MKNKKVVNSVANLVSRIWGVVSTYIFIPLYIKYLGETTYGLVSFFATLQASFTLLGLGLSSTLRREFAVGDESYENRLSKKMILRSVENIYGVIAIFIIAICFLGSPFIANEWLNIQELDPIIVEKVISLMGISIGLQLISNLWFGCILGLGHQVIANCCSITWAALKSIGSVIISITIHNVVYFYVWHVIIDIIYLITLRLIIEKKLDVKEKWHLKDFANLKRIWKYALGLFAISIIALITKQFDKALISKFLTLSELGAYNLATTLGNLAVIFSAALSITSLTDLTKKCSSKENDQVENTFLMYNGLVSIIVITMGAFVAFYSPVIISLWTRNENYVSIIENTAPLVVMAITFIGLQEIPYSLTLAHGNTKINNTVGIVSLPFIIVITYVLIKLYGVFGAGIAYLVTMVLQTTAYLFLVYRKYMRKHIKTLYIKNLLIPLVISITSAILSKRILSVYIKNELLFLIIGVAVGFVTLAFIFALIGREYIKSFFKKRG